MGYIYLLHFDKPLKHAKHYLGYAENDVESRIERHRNGTSGVKLFEILRGLGQDSFQVAKIWEGKKRADERKMKGRGKGKICPICKEELTKTK